ncbi:MAG: LemA family protein [Tissierella sp.]|uniref:LemA family protein n=1 Tax=Tissierella sp. TaxID=41274 RepID=UPI003F9A8A8C
MKKSLIPIIIVVLILAFVGGSYNSLVTTEEDVENSWAQVENVLKRRADLIPNLLETVKGFAAQEKEVLTQITEARSKISDASTPEEYAEADAELQRGVSSLNVVVENYPELRSNENFLELQAELSSTENKISTERMRYNDSVSAYNKKIKRFPTNIYAGIFGFDERQYFEIDEADSEVPDVEF